MVSVWEEGTHLPKFSKLQKNINTDVLIIGAGLAGVLCGYTLKNKGVDCVIVDSGKVCGGTTANTTAKITSQHGLIYSKLIRQFGTEKAALYLKANEEAIRKYRNLCKNIDCDFEEQDSFVYSTDDSIKIAEEMQALKKIGFNAEHCSELPLPIKTAGAVKFSGQAQFNPLKFVKDIINGLEIYENTRIVKIEDGKAVTESGEKINAKNIIVTTHFPIFNKHGSYFLKMYQHRSYVLALEGARHTGGMYVDEYKKGLSFRSYGDLLLLGGGGHRTGKQGGNFTELEAFAREKYPKAKVKYRWAAQDCITLDGVPYIGKYSANTEGLYVATGFNKWGMTSAMVAAKILPDLILGKSNRYAEVFSPSRTILRPQLAVNALEATVNLLTPTTRRCPHLGCALKWNAAEHSWDCPCHGSRFDEGGKLLDCPSVKDLNV